MAEVNVAEGAVALKLLHMLIDIMIRRQVLTSSDLEHMVACLNMEAHRRAENPSATVSRAGADTVRAWLLDIDDGGPRRRRRPALKLVKDDKPGFG